MVLPLVGKITIKSIFATTKQVRNIVLEIEILICVCLCRTKSTIQTTEVNSATTGPGPCTGLPKT